MQKICKNIIKKYYKNEKRFFPISKSSLTEMFSELKKYHELARARNGRGRKFKISLEKIFEIFLKYTSRAFTFEMLAIEYNIDATTASRYVDYVLLALENSDFHFKKNFKISKLLKEDNIKIVDSTDIEISAKNEVKKSNYSGKNKIYCKKIMVTVSLDSRLVLSTELYDGAMHDKKAWDNYSKKLKFKKTSKFFVDKGFQGIKKDFHNTFIPKKEYENMHLTEEDKSYNTSVSFIRSLIERIFGNIKNRAMLLKYSCRVNAFKLMRIFNVYCSIFNFEVENGLCKVH